MNEPPDKKQKYIDWGDIRSGQVNISQTSSPATGGNIGGDKFVGRDSIDWGESAGTIRAHLDHAVEYIRSSGHGTAEQRQQLMGLVTALSAHLSEVADEDQPDAGMIAYRVEAVARELTHPSLNRQEISYVTDDLLAATKLLPETARPTQEIAELVRALCDEG